MKYDFLIFGFLLPAWLSAQTPRIDHLRIISAQLSD
jgi:hypothetical protein